MDERPLVLTAALAPAAQAWLDGWREEFFPPERNHLAAHLTLFHALPGQRRVEIVATLEAVAARTAPISARADRLRCLGRGVAIAIDAPPLVALRAQLANAWSDGLTSQDEQPLRPHVTVCNKVTSERARAVGRELATRFVPRDLTLPGLALFAYAGGPWDPLGGFPFQG